MHDVFTSSDLPDADDVRSVRLAAVEWLAAEGVDEQVADRTVLVASELTTNALRHARSQFIVSLGFTEGRVRAEVFDLDTRAPQPVVADDAATGGRGLQIVAAISADWGFRTEERDGVEGKVVWAEIDMDLEAD